MKKIYFAGNILDDNGPAIVNKNYYIFLKKYAFFCASNNKIKRIFHYMVHVFFTKKIIISGFSYLNYCLLILSNFFRKKTYYLMHGYVKMEMKYSNIICEKKIKNVLLEQKILKHAYKIICVSEKFANFLSEEYPEFKNKICFVNNGVNYLDLKNNNKKTGNIISLGGGVAIKNNIAICKALEKIKYKNKYIVVGPLGQYGDEIKKYKFVEYYDHLSNEKVLEKMKECSLYVQNSYFETFSLASAEAINSGCDLLLSNNIGFLSIVNNITDEDLIYNPDDINEISKKIAKKIKQDNINISIIDEKNSWENRSYELLKILGE